MAIQEYLKLASANLQRAVVERKQQAVDMRNQADRIEVDAKKQVADLKSQSHMLERKLIDPNVDVPQKAVLTAEARNMSKHATAIEHNASVQRQQMLDAAKNMEQDAESLQRLATDLENRATNTS